ncbi:MAG: hypothetical protein H0W44_07015 [Gammaproteobacteria bacterium]|nr:hypothetical protein [Gammaproteobacteria bacterium]
MNDAQVENLFSGKPVVIKKNADGATAEKFKAALSKAGADCKLVPAQNTETPSATPANNIVATAAPRADTKKNTPDMEGVALSDPHQTMVNLRIPDDLSHLSMSNAGEVLVENAAEIIYEAPDLSKLSLTNNDGYLTTPTTTPEPKIDTTGLSLKPAE